jgi:hypothetical protein
MLSKSEYMMFLKQPACMWLKKHDKTKLPPVDDNTQAMFDAGNLFETYAEQLFPDGVRLGFDSYNEYLSDKSLREENETERVACGQLMLVTTVLLSANVVALGNGDLLKSITSAQKLLVLLGISLLITSIFAGIKYYFVLVHFHLDWANALNKVVDLHSDVDFKTFKEAHTKTDEVLKDLSTLTPKLWMKRQIGLLAAGVSAYLLLWLPYFLTSSS